MFFLTALARHIDVPVKIDFLAISSFSNKSGSPGVVRIAKDLDESIEGEDVLLAEDIVSLTLLPAYANIGMYQRMKNLTWLADSRSNVKSFPAGVQDDIGYALYAAQLGELSVKARPLHGLGGQVMEIAAHDASGTYRAVYTVSIGESIYVIHAFQKKSKAGIATPKSEMDLVRQRLKQLRSEVKNAEKRGP